MTETKNPHQYGLGQSDFGRELGFIEKVKAFLEIDVLLQLSAKATEGADPEILIALTT